MRTPALVYSQNPSLISNTGIVQSGIIHSVDWYATLLDYAGITPDSGIDGVSQRSMLLTGAPSSRTEFVYNIISNLNKAAIRVGDFKLIEGRAGRPSRPIPVPVSRRRRGVEGLQEEDEEEEEGNHRSKRAIKYRLYNIVNDPYETTDLSGQQGYAVKLSQMKAALEAKRASEIPPNVPPPDSAANNEGNWEPGWCTGNL